MLSNNKPPSPPKEHEEEKEESVPQENTPPFPEFLTHPFQHTLEGTELLGELKNLFVKIPLPKAIKANGVGELILEDFINQFIFIRFSASYSSI